MNDISERNPQLPKQDDIRLQPIHGSDTSYTLVLPTKGNIQKIADVCAKRIDITDRQRSKYASEAGYEPVDYIVTHINAKTGGKLSEEDLSDPSIVKKKHRTPVYSVEDVYNELTYHAALAQVLFNDFPAIVQEQKNSDGETEVVILDKKTLDKLREDVVNQAFFTFTSKRSVTRSLLGEYLMHSSPAQNHREPQNSAKEKTSTEGISPH
jgi:hypothetical protein